MSLRSLDNALKNFFHKNADHPKFRKKGRTIILQYHSM